MRWARLLLTASVALHVTATPPSAQPTFVNGVLTGGHTLDATRQPDANAGRFGFFSDLYYDPIRKQWWALSDRGPGGGVLDYATRIQRINLDVDPVTGRISDFKIRQTIRLTDPQGLLPSPTDRSIRDPRTLNGLNPLRLNGDAAVLGRSFDPEGLVIDPRTGHFLVADEYGPSVYEFDRKGRLRRMFQTPVNLVPTLDGAVNYVADRNGGATGGRQDNRGFEGLAITPDGRRLYAVLQDPLINEPPPNNGPAGRHTRIVAFDNDRRSPTYGTSIAQYVYQLESQRDVSERITAAGGSATDSDPHQGRDIGISALAALNDHQFLVLERDNRGIGADDPAGARVIGSKRVYQIDITGATDVTALPLPAHGNLTAAGIVPATRTGIFIDLALNTLLPNDKRVEKWEGLTIGPQLKDGGHVIVAGNDNDYSVTQNAGSVQFDVYVDFLGHSLQRDLDQPTRLNGQPVDPVPAGYVLLPGVLHAFKASATDLAEYVTPDKGLRGDEDDDPGHDVRQRPGR